MTSIVFTEGPLAGERVEVEGDMTVGRLDCDVLLNDHQVSRRHLALRPAGDELHVEDLGSKNGTLVNGHRITETVSAGDGTVISVGTSEFIVQTAVPAPAAPDPATPPGAIPVPAAAGAPAPTAGLPRPVWGLIAAVEIAVILTALVLLVHYAV